MKLPNGYGTVSKLSGKRRKPWRACLAATYELIDGKKLITNRPVLGYYRTRSEALQALAEYHKDPAIFNATTLTFSKLYEFWSKEKYATADIGVIKPMTYAYRRCTDLYDLKLKDIKTELLQETIDNKGISYATRKSLRILFSQMFKYAIRCEYTYKNPAQYLTIGKLETKVVRRLFTKEETKKLWELQGDTQADILLILLYTGMRIGELFSLRVEDINLEEKYMVGGSKTEAGKNRIIPIADKILPIIRNYYDTRNQTLLATEDTKFLTFRARIVAATKRWNMEHTPHDTRHTFISNMDFAGVPLLTTQKIIGHATGVLTQDIYTHRFTQELIEAVNRLD